jgi:hypothetical protein
MMNADRGKWLIRIGSIIILLGFFMPTMLVSCSGMSQTQRSFSLYDLANQLEQPILYLLLIGTVISGGISLLKASQTSDEKLYLWLELGAMVLGIFSAGFALLSFSNQVQTGSYGVIEVKPAFGILLLISGIVSFGAGWVMELNRLNQPNRQNYVPSIPIPMAIAYEEPPTSLPDYDEPRSEKPAINEPEPRPVSARLEVRQGSLPQREIIIDCDNFTIGRSSENRLRIHDPKISRHHVRFRAANGAWFIQDVGSKGGTFVNGQQVPAQRLKTGDEITIGNHSFVFYE